MSLNTSHTGNHGVLIYNGEMILSYCKKANVSFDKHGDPAFKGGKKGQLYLMSHRLIFNNSDKKDRLHSFCMPFHCMRDVKRVVTPIWKANYLQGVVLSQPNCNFSGEAGFKLMAMLRAADLVGNVYMYEQAPPYEGIGSTRKPLDPPEGGKDASVTTVFGHARIWSRQTDGASGSWFIRVVYSAKLVKGSEMVAIKKVLQDKRFKSRQLQIIQKLQHPNIVTFLYWFYSSGEKKDELYLNLMLE